MTSNLESGARHAPAAHALPAGQADVPLRCASGRIDITPPRPVPLAGVQGRLQPWSRVASPLEANVLLLSQGGEQVLLLTADLLYIGEDLAASARRAAARCGIPAQRVVLVASHTHFAPATDRSKPDLGAVDAAYLAFASAQLESLVAEVCAAPLQKVRLEATRLPTQFNVNRRRRWPLPTFTREGLRWGPNIVMAPVPDAARDAHLDALRLVDAAGDVHCVVWKYACHPVSFPDSTAVHAEYPGLARQQLRAAWGREVPVLFLQGFTGDVRPNLPGRRTWRDRLQTVRRGPGFGEVDLPMWQQWAGAIADSFCRAAGEKAQRTVSAAARFDDAAVDMARVLDAAANPQAAQQPMQVQRLAFGDELELLFFAAEVCSPYLRAFGAGERTWCVGYTGHVFGYLPSQRQADEGGYEGGGFFARFGLSGRLQPGFEAAVLEAVARLRAGGTNVV
jgi:hypothetical protein